MRLYFVIALRNLVRNKVRTFLNLAMIIGAFSSIVIFRGFAHYMLYSIEQSSTEGLNGHIQIAKPQIWNNDLPKHKEDGYILGQNKIISDMKKISGIKTISDRAHTYILLVNGDKSVAAQALGYNPQVETNIEKSFSIEEGSGFSKNPQLEILIGAGLQKALQLKIGQNLSIVSQTLTGSMSSLDVEIKGIIKTGLTELDNTTVYLPLTAVQKLLGTERAEKIIVILDKEASLEQTLELVKKQLSTDLIAKSWKESATLFKQLTDFYQVQNLLVEVILSTLVFFGILNTLGMSIYERIGEIGTLRALGDRTETIFFQLIFEGLLLGITGALIAIPISYFISYGFSNLEIAILMPGASKTMPVHLTPHLEDFLMSSFIVMMTCLTAILWPVRKALKISIVDALRANS